MENSPENLSLNNPIVTILDDEDDGNLAANDISLREAIVHSQDGSKVSFDNSLKNKTILLTRGELSIDKNLTIQGFDNGQLIIDGNNKSRVFNINNNLDQSVDVTLENLTITDGNAGNQNGGGIRNEENLTINDSIITSNSATTINNTVVSNNSAKDGGGGIYHESNTFGGNAPGSLILNASSVTSNSTDGYGGGVYNDFGGIDIDSSTIDQNTASDSGGGIYQADGAMKIDDSTISNNQADSGGGFYSSGFDSDSTFINSTISGNTATVNGGGIFISTEYGYHTVTSSTITNNSAPKGGGVYRGYSGETNITSSIIAGNVDNNDADGAGIISGGNNLIGNGDSAPDFVNLFKGDLVGTANKTIDPQLGELKDNGGNTFTHALLPKSLAINTGSNPNKLTTDQRGLERSVLQTDIGAYEVQPGSIDTANLEIIDGGLGDDILTGTAKKNILNGKAGNDTLKGGQQFDRLNGGDGDDVLIGNGGIDVLLGEKGKDLFYLQNIKGSLEWIRDFELNQDRLGLADNITDDELEIAGRVNSFISYQGEELAVVLGVSPSQLTQEQFQEI